MEPFQNSSGSVYVLENLIAERTKVGMTGIGANDVADRLRDINEMWTGRKLTCQICGGRISGVEGIVPPHIVSGRACVGGGALPLEKSVALADQHLEKTRARINVLWGVERGSAVRIAKTLERKIEKYRYFVPPTGTWQFTVAYFTEGVAEVEWLAHQKLAARLDRQAPFGEVFCCSPPEAIDAVEAALNDLGRLKYALKRTRLSVFQSPSQQQDLWKDE